MGSLQGLKKLMDKINSQPLPLNFDLKELSMGMSGDYQIAQEEGSNYGQKLAVPSLEKGITQYEK